MREAFHEHLDDVSGRLIAMTRQVGDMIGDATTALLSADIHLADSVVAADSGVNRAQDEVDEQIAEILATQGPVAGDLRRIIAALRITADIERMGDLATHVAKVARMRYPDVAVPPELRATYAAMGESGRAMALKAGRVIRTRDVMLAKELAADDDEMDRLHRSMFGVILDHGWDGGTEKAVDLALLGRYYERFADHAVTIASNIVYIATGSWPTAARGLGTAFSR
jgi:phosphate transport system protein